MNPSTQYLYQWLEIDKEQFLHNIQLLQEHIHPDIAVVVKGNAYGHDLKTAVELFREAGIQRFFSYHPQHALKVKERFPECRVIAMGPVQLDQISLMVENEIELYIWDASFMDYMIDANSSWGKKAKIHLEIETGMFRTGIDPNRLEDIIEKTSKAGNIELTGICTHFSGADEEDNLDRIQDQFKLWNQLKVLVRELTDEPIDWHGPNSSAGIELPPDTFTFARVGLLAYGFFPSEYSMKSWDHQQDIPKPSIKLKSRTSGQNLIPGGSYSGYGKSWKPIDDTVSRIVPIGYADGFPRSLSHQWKVKAADELLSTLGRVNMNMTVIQAPGKEFGKQAEVILIDNESPFDWYHAAELSGRFIYELLTCLSPEIPRVVK